MDYIIDFSFLDNKKEKINSLNNKASNINKNAKSNFSSMSSSEISSIISRLNKSTNRLEKAYGNCKKWLNNYCNEVQQVEDNLTNGTSSSMTDIVEFKGKFEDIFSKVTIPALKTGAENNNSIDAKRKAFIGDVNDTSKYYIDPRYPNMQKDLRLFDDQTGEEVFDGYNLHMKVGEVRTFTVAVPFNAGAVKRIIRTTAADVSSQTDTYKITSSRSDIGGDPNNPVYVNYQYNHWPSGVDLHTNYYTWIIRADKPGSREISQTCEYESTAGIPKSMIGINVIIES